MPGNILNADTGFPQFTGDESSDQKIDKVMNYLYMLLEQLRYSLNNLDADNFNDTGLQEIGEGIARPLQTSFENEFSKTSALIEGISNEFGSQIRLLTDWIGTDADGNLVSSAASITQSVHANSAQITLLNQWKGTTSSSLAAVQTLASQNEAKISLLTNWKNTAEDDIDGLAVSVAAIEQMADENGASISQIVQTVGKDGEVNAASIVAAVNAAGSSVKINADHLDVDAIAIFKNTADGEGVTTINGDDIVLVANNYGDSISGITFYKWRYTDDTEEYHTLDSMFRVRTIDNEGDDENYARYAAQIQTLSTHEDDTRYHVALKLLSDGAMSLESDYSIYMNAGTYMTLEAYDNVRIRSVRSYSAFTGDNVGEEDYIFCTNGIYFANERIVNPRYTFTSTGIYYDGELVVATP